MKKDDDLESILIRNQSLNQFVDLKIVEKNKDFYPSIYTHASYLDLSHSPLYVAHYDQCIKMATLASKTLTGQSFFEFVNQNVKQTTYDQLFQTLQPIGKHVSKQLIQFLL